MIRRFLPSLPRLVWLLGAVSFFNDLASEMVIPLVPLLLAAMGGSPAVALGFIEGAAEALASLLKLWAGNHSDRKSSARKGLTVAGYALSNAVRPLIALTAHWSGILGVSLADRVGKGLRSAPRDALIALAVDANRRGAAFGLHRAFDNGGALAGALAAAAVLAWHDNDLRAAIWASAVPGALCVAMILLAVREPTPVPPPSAARDCAALNAPAPALRPYLLLVGVFTLGKLPETFLLLRGYQLGMTPVALMLLWAAYSAAKAATAYRGGRHADRLGLRVWMRRAWLGTAAGLALLGYAGTPATLAGASLVFGALYGLSEGGERALVAEAAKKLAMGAGFGWYHLVAGLGAIPGGLLLGEIWTRLGASYAFWLSAAVVGVCALAVAHLPGAAEATPAVR